ncbi:MAG TPA: hypothetical protein VFB67_06725 [Candidatus Polarisedimenticolaceae bacterium]|nr:hypothetical protein [Candidatus Polarisedimenticolaceae bacterium]
MFRPRIRAAAIAAAALVVLFSTRAVRASCGSASCFLVTRSDQGVENDGAFRVDLSFRLVDQSKKLEGSHETDEVLVPAIDFESREIEPDHHREIRTQNTQLQVDLAYGLTSRVSLVGSLPLYVERDHEHFHEVGTPEEEFSNADGTSGFGDVRVGARYAFLVGGRDLLIGTAAVKAPTGAYKLLDHEGAINEPTIQPGTGSWDGIVALNYVHHPFPSPFEWFVSGSGRFNRRNPLDYRVGDEALVSGGFNWAKGPRWVFGLQVNARHAGRDDYLGEGVPSTGSDSIALTPGVRLHTNEGAEIYGYLQLPVYQDVNESQLAPRAGFVIGISKSF